ncbi:MAG: hypothetical protein HQM12_03380 [SAR324 cluster bacterium]|nr:hypothetical protein [SAR324 cluster bacterium]
MLELGVNYASPPTGSFLDEQVVTGVDYVSGLRLAAKYTFENGLMLGREALSTVYQVKYDGADYYLIIVPGNFTIGWAWGDDVKYMLEVGMHETATIAMRSRLSPRNTDHVQLVDSNWFGVAIDWGGSELLGVIFTIRNMSLGIKDIYHTGYDLNTNEFNFGLGGRIRW